MNSKLQEVCGVYAAHGRNPGSTEICYEGELQIQEDGDVVIARWIIAADIMFGVGILSGDQLSIAFNFTDPFQGAVTGVVVYDILGSGRLEGRWTVFGGQMLGTETCVLTKKTGPLH